MNSKLPPPPQRTDFQDEETFQEAMSYWQTHIGRIKALTSRTSPVPSPSQDSGQ